MNLKVTITVSAVEESRYGEKEESNFSNLTVIKKVDVTGLADMASLLSQVEALKIK